jgi:hypothetical protein
MFASSFPYKATNPILGGLTSLNLNYFQRLQLLILSHWRLALQHPNQRHQDSIHHVTSAYNATYGNSITPEYACRMRW